MELQAQSDAMVDAGMGELGVDREWFAKQSNRARQDYLDMWSKKFPKEEARIRSALVNFSLQAGKNVMDYCWTKFRVENLGNEFGLAEGLHYDASTKEITMQGGLLKKLQDVVEGFFGGKVKVEGVHEEEK